MQIQYNKNQIIYKHLSINNLEFESVCTRLREDYVNWLSDTASSGWRNKTVLNEFKWMGLSTWWINNLNTRDAEVDNRGFKRLLIIYLCKYNKEVNEIITDDKLLYLDLKRNFSHINIILKKNNYLLLLKLNRYLDTLKIIYRFFEIKLILFSHKNVLNKNEKKIWFRTTFPANWINLDKQEFSERHYHKLISKNKNLNIDTVYAVFILRHAKDKKIGFWSLLKLINKLKLDYKDKVYFPEKEISFFDIIGIFKSTYLEKKCLNKLKKDKEFLKIFTVNNLNLSNILIEDWNNSFYRKMQYNKFHGLSFKNFFQEFNINQIIVTYGELFTHSKVYYYLIKKLNSKHKIVAIQHAINSKNKVQSYFRKNEFSNNENTFGNSISPSPDYFLLQGEQYYNIASEFFDQNKLKIIGSLKYQNFREILLNRNNIKNELKSKYKFIKEKNILLSPSVNDILQILNILKNFKIPKEWSLIIKPHPSQNSEMVQKNIIKYTPQLDIKIIDKENIADLIVCSDLVISGYSSVAIETLYFNVNSIRAGIYSEFPLFDFDKKIPIFYDSKTFQHWFYKKNLDDDFKSIDLNKTFESYFSAEISNTHKLFWDFIQKKLI